MKRTFSARARTLLANASDLPSAAESLSSGKSTFGRWCIPGLLPQQCTAVIYSPTGSGKTFFAVHLALCKAAGQPWFGKPMTGGTVVYLVTEDRPGVEARAVAAARHMRLTLEHIAFEFVTPFAIHADDWAASLIEVLTEIQFRNEQPIAAVFLDTLGASFGGRSQDDAAQMTLATDAMQAVAEHFKCAFVAIHHSGKDEARGMRGSQVLKDRVDAVLTLSKIKGGAIGINIEKQRNGALGAPLTCRLVEVDIATGPNLMERTCVVAELAITAASSPPTVPANGNGKLRELSGDALIVLDVIKASKTPIEVRKLGILTKASLQAYKPRGDDAIKQAVSYAKKTLLSGGYIEIDPEKSTVRIRQNA
jgi:hypothetical protein